MAIPIQQTSGIRLEATATSGIARVTVTDKALGKLLPWDRYVRLKAAADVLAELPLQSVLDAGGFDGALGFFLHTQVDVIDPATTGGSVLAIPADDRSYDAVAAIDVLEHIEPSERKLALREFARVARRTLVLNYPCAASKSAQELVLKLTQNSLIREHVEWELPDSKWVLDTLKEYGFAGRMHPHTSIAVWLGQYICSQSAPSAAADLNRYLVEHHSDEPGSQPLYHLLVCERVQ